MSNELFSFVIRHSEIRHSGRRSSPCLRMNRTFVGGSHDCVSRKAQAVAPFATLTQPHTKCGRSRTMLQSIDLALKELICKAKAEGKLTYEEVSALLPDEIEGTDRIDAVLSAIDGLGIELIDGPD